MGKKNRDIAVLNNTIDGLRKELEHFIERHHIDTATIGERLIKEAERHGHGPLYDEFAAALKRDLAIPLPQRPRPFTVTVSVELHIDVTALDAPDARDEAYPLVLAAEQHLDALPGITAYADRDSVKYPAAAR